MTTNHSSSEAIEYELGASFGSGVLFVYANGECVGGAGTAVVLAMLAAEGYNQADADNLVSMAMRAPSGQRIKFTVYR